MPITSYNAWQQSLGLVFFLLLTYSAAAIGGVGSVNAPLFYRELILPSWAPPAWLFGPVWTILYTLMAIAAWLVWRSGALSHTLRALQFYLAQLVLNALWSWLFFAWFMGAAAFIDIILLWLAILLTMRAFYQHSKLACWLLLPYLLWVSFAALLNFNLWQANPLVL